MDKFKEIRPIVLGIVIKNNKLLVAEGYDKVKKNKFYRCLGGGIEFLEKSDEALKREFLEELGINITVKEFLGITENIFTYNGKKAHEIVFYYKIDFDDSDYKEEYQIQDSTNSEKVVWIDTDTFKNNKAILYPEEIIQYI